MLKLIVGLGNPGIEYAFTPHNFGFLLLDELANRGHARFRVRECQALTARTVLAGTEVRLAKPETFMNLSGVAVRALMAKYGYEPAEILVACDDLDLPLGTLRLREHGSPGTHNGLRSVAGALGTDEYPRLRLGIGPARGAAERFVLTPWKQKELDVVAEVLDRAADALEMIPREGMAKAMSVYNARPGAEAGG
jgi:PTH1 family peptidyl-tRNA hydrolase